MKNVYIYIYALSSALHNHFIYTCDSLSILSLDLSLVHFQYCCWSRFELNYQNYGIFKACTVGKHQQRWILRINGIIIFIFFIFFIIIIIIIIRFVWWCIVIISVWSSLSISGRPHVPSTHQVSSLINSIFYDYGMN